MFKKETDMSLFENMEVVNGLGDRGRIQGSFGKSGKYKVYFPEGVAKRDAGGEEGAAAGRLTLRFRRYVFDKAKKMVQ